MPSAAVTLPDGTRAKVTFDTPDQLDATVNDLVKQHEPNPVKQGLTHGMTDAISEPLAHFATGAVAGPVSGLAGIAAGLTGSDPVKAIEGTQEALTYQPRSAAGKAVTNAIEWPFKKLGQLGDKAGGVTTNVTGSPLLGAAVNTGVQSIPALIGKGAGMLGKTADASAAATATATAAKTAEDTARAYVARHTRVDWASLPDAFKKTLTTIAKDSGSLDKLDPAAVEREARLAKLGLPATRGQVTRDLSQLTREEALTKSDAGKPIRDINAEQDRILHEHLDTLRNGTGAKAVTKQQVGTSVQGAARSKLSSLRKDYQDAYSEAKKQGATLDPADISPLKSWLKNPTNRRNAPYLEKAIEDYEARGEKGRFIPKDHVSINNLEEIRKEAAANSKKPGPEGHFAKEANKVIDDILDSSGSDLYKDARGKFKAVKDEFDRQGRVAGLVKSKGMTADRAVALEDTFDNVVLRGSNEQLQAVQKTLTTGGKVSTRESGRQAWSDLQGAAIDYLKDKAAGKRAIPGEKNQLQFNSSFLDAVFDLDKDGKLDTLFGKGTSAKIREIAQATQDVRTKPTGRISGSYTAPRIVNFLEKLAEVPVVGKYAAGAAKLGSKVASMGSEVKEVAKAKTSPTESAAATQAKVDKTAATRANTLKSLRNKSGFGAMTLQDNGP